MGWFLWARARAHRLLVTAALLTVVLATSVLASLTAFTSAVGDAGLSRSLEGDLAPRALVDVRASLRAGHPEGSETVSTTDKAVRAELAGLFPEQSVRTESSTQSTRYTLPHDSTDRSEPDFALLASFERERMELTEGDWPSAVSGPGSGSAPVQAVLPQSVARTLDLRPGDEVRLTSPQDGTDPVRVELSGLYRPADVQHPYWRLDPLEGRGTQTLSFTSYGPFVVDRSVFTTGTVPAAEGRWQADADFSTLTTDQLQDVRAKVASAASAGGSFGVEGAEVDTELHEVLDSLERSLLVSRSTLLIGALQLVLLTGLALLLVAQLLAAERDEESVLLRARGGSRTGLGALAAGEALLLTLPAALLAPWLATPLVGLLNNSGALADAGIELTAERTAAVWSVAALTALLCACAMTLPALRAPDGGATGQARAGSGRRAAAVRGGADIALVVLAVVAYLQLRRREAGGGELGVEGGGELSVDPVLVAAPALALLAGTVLALRLLPPLTRLGERAAARGRSLTAPLAGWQLGRRPTRVAAPAMLLVLAIAMGVFSLGQGASWERSQSDQADFQTGADVLVSGSTLPHFGQGGMYDELSDVTASAPVARDDFQVTEEHHTQVLATDTRYVDDVLRLRDDLAPQPLSKLLGSVKRQRHGTELTLTEASSDSPGAPSQWRFTAESRVTDLKGGRVGDPGPATELHAVIEDRHRASYRLSLGEVPTDGTKTTHTVDLGDLAGGGAWAGPLELVGVEAHAQVPTDEPRRHLLTLTGLAAVDAADWQGKESTTHHARLMRDRPDGLPRVREVATPSAQQLRVTWETGVAHPMRDTGAGVGQVPVTTAHIAIAPDRPPGDDGLAPPSAVVTDAYLEASGAKVGQVVKIQVASTEITVRIAGAVRALPTTTVPKEKDGGAVLLDLAELEDSLARADDGRPTEVTDWWLTTTSGTSERVAEELRARGDVESVTTRTEVAEQLRKDPLGAGPRTALTATAFVAVLLAATGFAASVTGAVRERGGEFAVLRALGASRGQLARVIALEHTVVVAVSLAVGTALGALLLRMVLPLIVLSAEAGQVTPPLLIELPVDQLALMLATMAVVPLLAVAVIALRRGDTGVERARGER